MTIAKLLSALCIAVVSVSSHAAGSGGDKNTPYFDISTPFVVNIQAESGNSFLQVNAQLRVAKPELKTFIMTHLPAIQHVMMLVLSEQTPAQLRSAEGKQQLREQAVKEIREFMQKEIGQPIVDEIYFTGFVIQ